MNSRFLVKSERTKTKRENKSAHDPGKIRRASTDPRTGSTAAWLRRFTSIALEKELQLPAKDVQAAHRIMAGSSFYLLAFPLNQKQGIPSKTRHPHIATASACCQAASDKVSCGNQERQVCPRFMAYHTPQQSNTFAVTTPPAVVACCPCRTQPAVASTDNQLLGVMPVSHE